MNNKLSILAIAGSLRRDSYNKAALMAAKELSPDNVSIEIFARLADIPPFNQDDDKNPPEAVRELKEKIRAADAVLFVTPEYNYSVPGVLKNAIDWASRPYGDNAWDKKPAGIIGASISMTGTARAQYHLRQMMVFLDMFPLNRPEVMIPSAAEKFDKDGNLVDGPTREKIREFMAALSDWTIRLQTAGINK